MKIQFALKSGVAAAVLSFAFAGSASAAGLFDFLMPQQQAPAYQAYAPQGDQPLQTGRSVAVTGDTDLAPQASTMTTHALVSDPTGAAPGTITISTKDRALYLSQGDGMAVRYSIGVGRDGFTWSGTAHIARKAEWPNWTPPKEMIARRPDIPHFMKGGLGNPLGARAMYLYNGKGDTGFRIHGTNEPDTIGQAVSSGCIRMMNADVEDLYERVKVGTKVVVL
jgi:lipoprotein-anchoring transpeptidase ErfK/SrfK